MKREIIKDAFYQGIAKLIINGKEKVKTAINLSMVYTYYEIGKQIFLEEQKGENRAKYGETIIENLSVRLSYEFGDGFSKENLKLMRRFYLVYKEDKIGEPLVTQFENHTLNSDDRPFFLSWSLYVKLMRIEDTQERQFYEIESCRNSWNIKELDRQFDSSLYQRLALSKNKEEIRALSREG